jgi:hypothetical protein
MNLRRKLFMIWCGFTVLWLVWGIVSDGGLVLLKYQAGGWRAAYMHLTLTVLIAVAIPLAMLFLGRIVLWTASRMNGKTDG